MKLKPVLLTFALTSVLVVVVATWAAAAFAQGVQIGAEAYRDGVKVGRTLTDSRQCTGSGDYRIGCVDGVQESQMDREADQAMDSSSADSVPVEHAPALSSPSGQSSSGNPDDGAPPND